MELPDLSRTAEWPHLAREAMGGAAVRASHALEPVIDTLPHALTSLPVPGRRRSGVVGQIRRHPVALGIGVVALGAITYAALRSRHEVAPASQPQADRDRIRSAA